MKRCPKCHYPNDDENKFCRECGTKLNKPKNYCPNCDRIFTSGEKFCVECGTKLIAKSESTIRITPTRSRPVRDNPASGYRSKPTPTRSHPVRDKPVSIDSYNVKVRQDIPKDTFGYIGRDSPTAEFEGKTREELELELRFVTSKYEDCKKTGDYMTTYYKDKKDILERLLEEN